MITKFKARIRDGGDSYIITVPKVYIKNDILSVGQEYEFQVDQVEENNE
jgi:hypothetical protein